MLLVARGGSEGDPREGSSVLHVGLVRPAQVDPRVDEDGGDPENDGCDWL